MKIKNNMKIKNQEKWADPGLLSEVRKYGKFDVNACLNCGGCTIVCSLTSNGTMFSPRRAIQYVRSGLKDNLRSSLDPWLCYYCGDCSISCPRQTETGESMMTLRRYLIGQYDWTGFTSRLYESKAWMIGALTVLPFAILALILLFFYPYLFKFGHIFTIGVILGVGFIIYLINILRMYWFTIGRDNPTVPFGVYLKKLKSLLYGVTQLQVTKCKEGKKFFWLKHQLVVVTWILTVGMSSLGWLANTYTYPVYHPFKLAMIIIPGILFVFTGILTIDRIHKRDEQMHKFAKFSDWAFLIGLFLMGFTFWLAYVILLLGMEEVGKAVYAFHLMILSDWGLILVPFSKTNHFLYRPLAMYFYAVKEEAIQMKYSKEGKLPLKG